MFLGGGEDGLKHRDIVRFVAACHCQRLLCCDGVGEMLEFGDNEIGLDGKGLFGLEYSYDRLLHGRDGEQRKVMDAARKPIDVEDLTRARSGRPVRLTIDAEVQQKTEEVLSKVTAEYAPIMSR